MGQFERPLTLGAGDTFTFTFLVFLYEAAADISDECAGRSFAGGTGLGAGSSCWSFAEVQRGKAVGFTIGSGWPLKSQTGQSVYKMFCCALTLSGAALLSAGVG